MSIHPFITFLVKRLQQPLPGESAQKAMAPTPLDSDFTMRMDPTADAHPSSVLVPIYTDEHQNLNIIFTLRTKTIRHAGQISFPGGRSENGEAPVETALRESHEEINLPPGSVQVLGQITPLYLYRTNNQITPFIGYLDKEPTLQRNPVEVEEIITVSVEDLVKNENKIRETWELEHATFDVPYWNIHSTPLWGATAMMTSELIEIYREFLDGK